MTNTSKYSNVRIIHLKESHQVQLAYRVRHEVYVLEQGYALNVMTDDDDMISQHWAAIADRKNDDDAIELNVPIGTVRLVPNPNNVARLGRVAVISDARGLGVGPQLIQVFTDYCKKNDYHTIYLHAVSEKRGFYEKLGFVVEEGDHEEFEEDGTPHIRLWKRQLLK